MTGDQSVPLDTNSAFVSHETPADFHYLIRICSQNTERMRCK
jgi:hypothetical protein